MNKRWLGLLAAFPLVLTSCGGDDGSDSSGGISGEPEGEITVLTNRTDRVEDGTFDKYAAEFQKVYPDVTVKFQALTDYEGEVKIRMNTEKYGDVLLIPSGVQKADYPDFFEPLGSTEEMSEKYNWTQFTTVEDDVYGLATFGNANGMVYNKKVWAEAGVEPATTPEDFVAALQAIQDKTDAIPYYTNYKDGWPVGTWQGAFGSPNCDTEATTELATDTAPWEEGKGLGTIDSLLYDIVEAGLIEPDPTTTNWEDSKAMLGKGEISSMWLGSWAMVQMQQAAEDAGADPADIGFMPFPAQPDGEFCSVTGPDLNQAINVNSEHKAAAKAWIDWFTNESGFATDEGSIPTTKGAELPDTLADYTELGVTYIELNQDKAAEVQAIDLAAEIGLTAPDYRQKLVDVARGAADGDKASVFAELNDKWATGLEMAGL